MRNWIALSALALLLCGCASTPDVTYTYHLATSRTTVAVTQNVACDASGTRLLITYSAPTVTTNFMADPARTYSIPIHELDSAFANTDIGVTLSDDGRLKGVNAANTGEATTILKSFINATTTVAPIVG